MDDETAMAAFRELELFADFNDDHLRLLAFVCQERILAAGETLCEAGDMVGGAHVLVTGQLEAVHSAAEGGGRYRIMPPSLIGEIGLMLDKPRATGVVALRRSEVLFVPREAFMKLLRSHPDLAQGVAATLRGELLRYLDSISGLSGRFSN
ncbi:cyclic nucleotide-binding domain-containing protein [Pelagibacterium luteolum]|uniref:Cyclic nucleotide-binding domain-containing protein n=1 Tax=Pelagibacterium luteolum TaxID=440168 RepID=A0A1G7SIG7_9HYPH|nr:cyclic nucleotide-binding domain-containing protein [Pelagibacterium luteolum]SDG22219.1 Cyclic nucleotide-binding domain-containing protein [Pelagibacterium luteolum]